MQLNSFNMRSLFSCQQQMVKRNTKLNAEMLVYTEVLSLYIKEHKTTSILKKGQHQFSPKIIMFGTPASFM